VTVTEYSPRLLLKRCPAEDTVTEYATRLGWTRVEDTEADAPTGSSRELRWIASPVLRVHYLENEVTGNCYVYVAGEHRPLLQALSTTLVDALDAWTLEELRNAFDESADEAVLGENLIRLAMGAPQEMDSRVLRRLESALSHPSDHVRELAVWAVSFTPWPQFRPPLNGIARQDENPALRDKARRMLDSFDAAGVEES
jgi:hypothetical protein